MNNQLQPTTLVIFGFSGDLVRRKLLPSLAEIAAAGSLPNKFKILGISRKSISPEDVLLPSFSQLLSVTETMRMDVGRAKDYSILKAKLRQMMSGDSAQYIFYLALPP